MRLLSAAVLFALALVTAEVAAPIAPGAGSSISPLTPAQRERMTGVVWRPGCPVGLRELRAVTVTYVDFEGRTRAGTIVVHHDVSNAVARIFARLRTEGVPVRRIRPIEAYGGSDFASIEADNTSAFNCRRVDGTSRWSEHAYGRAIDINPVENPYVSGGRTSHAASRRYLDRSRVRPGMAVAGGPLVRAFAAEGWAWGGTWTGVKDYQHFSASGR